MRAVMDEDGSSSSSQMSLHAEGLNEKTTRYDSGVIMENEGGAGRREDDRKSQLEDASVSDGRLSHPCSVRTRTHRLSFSSPVVVSAVNVESGKTAYVGASITSHDCSAEDVNKERERRTRTLLCVAMMVMSGASPTSTSKDLPASIALINICCRLHQRAGQGPTCKLNAYRHRANDSKPIRPVCSRFMASSSILSSAGVLVMRFTARARVSSSAGGISKSSDVIHATTTSLERLQAIMEGSDVEGAWLLL